MNHPPLSGCVDPLDVVVPVAVSSADDRDGFPTLLSSMLLLANTTIGCS